MVLAKQVKGLFPGSSSSPGIKLPTPTTQQPAVQTPVGSDSNPFAFDDSPPEPPRASRSKGNSSADDSPNPSRSGPKGKTSIPTAESVDEDDPPPRSSKKSSPSSSGNTKLGSGRTEDTQQKARSAPSVAAEFSGNPFSFEELTSPAPKPQRSREDESKEEPRRRKREEDDDDRPKQRRRDEDEDEDEKPRPKNGGGLVGRNSASRPETSERKPNRARDEDDDDEEDDRRDRKRKRDDDDDERDSRRGSSDRRRRDDDDDEDKPRPARRRVEELKERKATVLHKTGESDDYEYSRCWNGIEEAGLNAAELVVFCTTRSRHEMAMGSKLAGFFTGKKAAEPLYHLAVFQSEAVVLFASEDGSVQTIRFPFETLVWQFLQGDELPKGATSDAADLFRTQTEEELEDLDRTIVLTLKSPAGECFLRLFRGSQTKSLRQALVDQLMKQAEVMFQQGRYVLSERYLDRIPEACGLADEIAKLRERMGIRVEWLPIINVDIPNSLPCAWPAPAGRPGA